MRSLTVKLTLAFLLVGVIGALLVAAIVGQTTRSAFDRFLSDRDQTVLVDALGRYYAGQGSWNGVGAMLDNTQPLNFYSRSTAVTDANGVVVFGHGPYAVGQRAPADTFEAGVPIRVNNQLVGYMLVVSPGARANSAPPPPEDRFVQQVTWAAVMSAAIAALIALILGVLLARTLTRPVRELTAATTAMARGALDQSVEVRSRDEIGELASAFNQMSADLGRASQLRKQMTADLAHDLRTPLSILRGYTEGLQDGRLRGAPAIYTIMHGEVEHLQRLVEDLRVLSLADAGELPLGRRAVDPAALLERTGLAYIVSAEAQGVALKVETEPDLPSIAVDTDRMTQVLNNLVSNALRYTPSGGTITLAASSEIKDQGLATKDQSLRLDARNSPSSLAVGPSSFVVLRVSDTGQGIAPEDLPFVFDRFYRADKARQRTDNNASGLGLAIAKAIVEAHGATLAVDSVLGAGTTFTITLPVAPQHDVAGERPAAERRTAAVGQHEG
jgi:two-component system, OmpR family, sensor histidine kinase BaeS